MRARILVPVALAVAAILLGAAGFLLVYSKESAGGRIVTVGAEPGGPFRLTDQTGATLSDADLKGRPFAVFFGFTHCPEVCPTTLWEMSQALQALGPDADRLRVLFITVDPERDRPETLRDYLQSFDRRITGLTGTPDEIAAVAKSYRVYWRKVPTDDGDYTMDHSAMVYLMDAEGRFVDMIAYGTPEPERLAALRRLLAGA